MHDGAWYKMNTTLSERREYIISDTHFNHSRLVEYCGRPTDFTERIIANWQRVVTPDDTVYHLGDVLLGRESTFSYIMGQLPGFKVLVDPGNHDPHRPAWYLARGFHAVFNGVRMGKRSQILLTHKPVIPLPDDVRWNIHGHFHNADDRRLLTDHSAEEIAYYHRQGDRYQLLHIEDTLAPVPLEVFFLERGITR